MTTFTCLIKTEYPFAAMQKLFAAEFEHKHARSDVALTQENKKAIFNITAQDITALRATINSVTSVLGMYEKTIQITTHGNR